MMKLEYHPLTVEDLNAASFHYEQQQYGLSKIFLAEVHQAIKRIQANPFLYAEVSGIRRVLLKQFPYSILYRLVTSDCIRILVIRHHRRHPVFGSARS